jgi:excinuclease ABC subunit A
MDERLLDEQDERITIRGAREHNLKDVDLDIPRNRLVVVTGLSGSGKSSLAFDTIYAEGQRRYMESLSAYARQFLGVMERPDVDFIDGLSPVIAIEQKTVSRNPRSTVGTVTEIYDFLRLLYARAADAYSYVSGRPMRRQSDDEIIDAVVGWPEGAHVVLLAPVVRGRKGHYRELFEQIAKQGFERVRVDGDLREIAKGMQLDRYKVHDVEVVVDRFPVKEGMRSRVAQSVEVALGMGGGTLIALVQKSPDEAALKPGDHVLSRHLTAPEDGLSYEDPSPNTFSFNSPYGACPACNGLGAKKEIDPELVVPRPSKTIAEGGIAALGKPRDVWVFSQLRAVADAYGFDFDTPWERLTDAQRQVALEGAGEEQFEIVYKYKGREVRYQHRFHGVYGHVQHTWENTSSATQRKWAEAYMRVRPCRTCGGGRLKPEALAYRVGPTRTYDGDRSIADLVQMDLRALRAFFAGLALEGRQAASGGPIVKEIGERVDFLLNVGLDYLTLDRPARTLSGGESQRIRLATQIGTQLTGVLYVLDEPSIGLHPRDNTKLIHSLQALRDLGNSVLVVEHDREMIEAADFVVDLGPGAGEYGGHVLAAGPPEVIAGKGRRTKGARRSPRSVGENGQGDGRAESLTTAYLSGRRSIAVPKERRAGSGERLVLRGARGHNLKDVDFALPLGTLTVVTGVSGSGKSSLVNQTLYPILANRFFRASAVPLPYDEVEGVEALDKVVAIDQSPIGRTPRSNPATYTGLFGLIRDLFARLPEAQIRGYKPGRFSFNVKGGRCENCKGAGIVKLEMNFLPDVHVECEVCRGRRFNPETLEVRYKGATIAEVLEMPVSEALPFFEAVPGLARKLRTLDAVGLGYIRLGQQATTLSGGEAQRVKLARELSRPGTGRTLYLLDEPTTGLHFEDVRHLLVVLQALVEKGNTVLVIEHNMDVAKQADHVVDLGPDGGDAGGRLLFAGTPEALAETDGPTAVFMRAELARTPTAAPEEEALDLDALAGDEGEPEEEPEDEEAVAEAE